MTIIEFVQSVLPIPYPYEFITYIVSGSLLVVFAILIIGAFLSLFTSIFHNKY